MVQLSRPVRQDGIDPIGLIEPVPHEGQAVEPARIAPKFFYDAQGSALYEAICRLQEYYPPRTEAAIFEQHRAAIAAALPRGAQWVDLGCIVSNHCMALAPSPQPRSTHCAPRGSAAAMAARCCSKMAASVRGG